jgi:hypothetical protein
LIEEFDVRLKVMMEIFKRISLREKARSLLKSKGFTKESLGWGWNMAKEFSSFSMGQFIRVPLERTISMALESYPIRAFNMMVTGRKVSNMVKEFTLFRMEAGMKGSITRTRSTVKGFTIRTRLKWLRVDGSEAS